VLEFTQVLAQKGLGKARLMGSIGAAQPHVIVFARGGLRHGRAIRP
jgi:hypothetical protein